MTQALAETVRVIATLRAASGKEDELQSVLRDLAIQVRAEPGCTSYVVTRARKEPGLFKVIEGYLDESALRDHAASPHMQQTKSRLADVLAERLLVEVLEVVA